MTVVYLTGLSGVGKTSALTELNRLGYQTIDTDYGDYVTEVPQVTGTVRLLKEDKMAKLLESAGSSPIFISGCCDNQGTFYQDFDVVVLLKAELTSMLERVEKRSTNDYGKTPEQRTEILENHRTVLPLLEKSADLILDTTNLSIDEVCKTLESVIRN